MSEITISVEMNGIRHGVTFTPGPDADPEEVARALGDRVTRHVRENLKDADA